MCAPSEFFTAAGRSAIGKVGRREKIYNILCGTISFSCEMSHGESGRITVFGANTVWNSFLAKNYCSFHLDLGFVFCRPSNQTAIFFWSLKSKELGHFGRNLVAPMVPKQNYNHTSASPLEVKNHLRRGLNKLGQFRATNHLQISQY